MAKTNFKDSAGQIVSLIGGKDNVVSVAHCITRIRFTLNDIAKAEANTDQIKSVPGVLSIVVAGGQFQVVIGPAVTQMYDEVIAITGKTSGAAPAQADDAKKKPSDLIMKLVSGILLPTMPALVGCGIVNALFTILSLAGLVTADAGIGMILYAVGQTCMYFFPVLLGGSAAKYFGMDAYLGNVIGAAMIYPTILDAANAGSSTMLFGILPLSFKAYTSTVFPAVAAVWFASVVYKLINKILPDVLKFSLTPFFTLLVTVPVSLLVIGPVVNVASAVVSKVVLTIYGISPLACGVILGGTWMLLIVPLGLHWGFMPVFINNIMTLGYEPVMGLLAAILTLSGTLTAVAVKSKDPDVRSGALSCAVSNALGISEPGLYGYVLTDKNVFMSTLIGGAITGIIPGLMHTALYSMSGAAGIFALPCYISPDGSMTSFWGAVLSNVVGFILCFALTYIKYDPDATR